MKTKKIKHAYNKTIMKKEVVVENLECGASTTTSKDLSRLTKRSRKYDPLIQSKSMKKSIELSKFDDKYRTQISDTPIFYFSSREKPFFKRDTSLMKQVNQTTHANRIMKLSNSFVENARPSSTNAYICKDYKKGFEDDKIPKYAVPKQIRRNNTNRKLTQLTELDEILVSLRFLFLQIKEMGHQHKKSN